MCFLACFQGRGEVEEVVRLLESQGTFIWGENQKKKFLTSIPVEALIPFAALKITVGQRLLTILTGLVTAEKLR